MKKLRLLLLLVWVQMNGLFAQILAPQVLSSGGAANDSFATKVACTIGQTVAATGGAGESILTQGFHQPNLPLLDSLPCYEIGEIPAQTVFQGTEKVFYVCAGTSAAVSMEIKLPKPLGDMVFNTYTKRFSFIPSSGDKGVFEVIFTAITGKDTAFQEVPFIVMPSFPPEQTAFGLTPSVPIPADDDDGYVVLTEVKGAKETFNHQVKDVYNISIAGKSLVFDKQLANRLNIFCVNPRKDVKELNLYAEKVVIRCALKFPQTNVTIHARTLVFEDANGETASINTQPEAPTASQGDVTGLKAGDLTLYLQKMSGDFAFRFRLIGGAGQGAKDGGPGGTLSSNLDLKPFFDAPGGTAGSTGNKGAPGSFQPIFKQYGWLHPYALRLVIAHTKVAYLNGHMTYTRSVADDYLEEINAYEASGEGANDVAENQAELNQLKGEMAGLSERIAQNRDYFGNPAGWVPMLSFEVNYLAFEQEIDRAIRVLYFCYWMQRINAKNEQKINALISVRKQQEQLIKDFQETYNMAVSSLDGLEAQAVAVSDEIDKIQADLAKLEQELLERAKYVVEERHKPPKRSLWRKIVGTVGAIAQVVPVYQPALGAIGAGLQTISNLDFSMPQDAIKQMYNVAKDISKADFRKSATDLQNVINTLDFTNISNGKDLIKYAKGIGSFAGVLNDSMSSLRKKLGSTQASFHEEIEVELDKMRAESPEFTDMTNRVNDLMHKKLQFQQKIASTLQQITRMANEIQASLVTIDGINLQAFNTGSKRDLRAMIYVKDMETRAKDRLTRYHYNLKKAYEYRLLEAYNTDLNLTGIFDRFKSIAETKGDDVELTAQEFQTLRLVYDKALSEVTETILTKYNNSAPELTTFGFFDLDSSDIAQLNKGQVLQLDFVRRGFVPPHHEAPRIRKITVASMKVHTENGQPGSVLNTEIRLEHSGISKIKKNGEVYFFNHYNNNTENKITWSATYDVKTQTIIETQPSVSNVSLLKVLLDKLGKYSIENIELYSRPSAWADLMIEKLDNSTNGVKIVLDELRFKIEYDYYQIPSGLVTLDIVTNDELKPCIGVGKPDNNKRQDGWGSFLRTYFKNANSAVTLKAPKQYGVWVFEKWSNIAGQTISTSNEIAINLASNNLLKANYKMIQPVLFVPQDTVYLPGNQGTQKVAIQNTGTGDMDWTCTGSRDWLRLQGDTTGLNNGQVTLAYEENPGNTQRIQYIKVIAPTSIRYIDTIVVIQDTLRTIAVKEEEPSAEWVRIYPNPATDLLNIEVDKTAPAARVALYNALGRLIQQAPLNGLRHTLPMHMLPKGVYFVEIVAGKRRHWAKVFLE